MGYECNRRTMRLWVDALRSGEFQQGRGQLKSTSLEYCCLGVACEVAIRDGLPLREKVIYRTHRFGVMETGVALPPEVKRWLGLLDPCGNAIHDPVLMDFSRKFRGPLTCSSANDIFHMSFAEIADLLEARYLFDVTEGADDAAEQR